MNDLTLTRSGEFDVVHVEGNTGEGVEFVDAWLPAQCVIDSGRIIIHPVTAKVLLETARAAGLTVDVVERL